MNAIELFHKDGKPAKVWYCEKCRHVAGDERTANLCCDWHYDCRVCGQKCERTHYLMCDKCSQAEEDKKELARFNSAEKLTDWDGPIYAHGLGSNEGFFEDISCFLDFLEEEELDEIKYVWAAQEVPFVCASIDSITESIYNNAYDDFDIDNLEGLEELDKAIDKFNTLNKDKMMYEINYSKAILLEKAVD